MRRTRLVTTVTALLFFTACGAKGSLPPGDSSSQARALGSKSGGAQSTTLSYIPLPAPYAFPYALVVGPDGAIWFGEFNVGPDGNRGPGQAGLGRLTTDGALSEVALASAITVLPGAFDASGNLWFGDGGGVQGNQTPGSFNVKRADGTVTSYPVVIRGSNARVKFSAAAPDGNVWFVLARANDIARVAPDGSFTTFAVPPTTQDIARPSDIVLGPDGALWFTEWFGNAIGRMTLDGTLTNVYPLPTAEAGPRFIAAGTDGALWFAENGSSAFSGNAGDNSTPPQIVRMTTSGQMTPFAMPPDSVPDSIRAANGGFVFADLGTNAVGFIDYSGNVVEYPIEYDGGANAPIGTNPGNATFAVEGPDGALYFTDSDLARIGKITLGKKGMIFPPTMTFPEPSPWGGTTNTQLVGVAVSGDRGPFSASTSDPNVATVTPLVGFPLNFTVTATGIGTTTLTIKGKGKPMTANVTVTSLSRTAQSVRRMNRHSVNLL